LLKIYIYGYLNRIQSSRGSEREAQRNVELMWLTGRLMPDFKSTANFRKDKRKAIRGVCRQFVFAQPHERAVYAKPKRCGQPEHHADDGRFKVRKLMREMNLISKQPGFHAYKKATVEQPDIANVLDRVFNVTSPNKVRCGDGAVHWRRPHQFNEGLAPAVAEEKLNSVAGISSSPPK